MTYLINRTEYRDLVAEFQKERMVLEITQDPASGRMYTLIRGSEGKQEEAIRKIFERENRFCPLFSSTKVDGCFAFTVSPYQRPPFFLFPQIFQDRWSPINKQRGLVSSSHSQGLTELLQERIPQTGLSVEIGAGIGYHLPADFRSSLIRIQPDRQEYQALKSASPKERIFEIDLEQFLESMADQDKELPFFFALNVWDTMPPEKRKENLTQIAQIQKPGERILALLDTCPYQKVTFDALQSRYSECALFPLFPSPQDLLSLMKISAIAVPQLVVGGDKPSAEDFMRLGTEEIEARFQGNISPTQFWLDGLNGTCEVIAWEDFFASQMKKELKEAGYVAQSFYHVSFQIERAQESAQAGFLIYKNVTNTMGAVYACPFEKMAGIKNFLKEKGIQLPLYFEDRGFWEGLKERGECVLGAEFLVIDAVKLPLQ